MKTNRLLYLCAHRMTAYHWHSGVLESEGIFATTDAGHQQFSDYIAQHGRDRFALLANVSEEGFHTETIPFLRGKDRHTVISRKLGQQFFNASLTASLSLGFEKSKRKNERIVLAALTNTAFFAPWLNAITNGGAALSGVYSLPFIAPSLLKRLFLDDQQCLLLTVQDQSIRQSYFEKGELLFSRLTPLQNSSISGIAQTFATEAIKLQQYLASQRLIGRNQPITAHVLAHGTALKAIQANCNDTATIRFNVLDIADCAHKAGLKTIPEDTHCELLFLHLLQTTPPRIQFANDDQRHSFHLSQIRAGLYSFSALALAGCLLFSGKLLYDAYESTQEAQALRTESALSQHRYNEITKTLPPIAADNETLRRVVDRYQDLDMKSTSPEGLYREISRALQAVPAADIDRIEWSVEGLEATASSAPPAPRPTSKIVTAPLAPSDSETAIVHGSLNLGQNAKPRQLLNAFDKFTNVLSENPKLQINVLKRPFDIESGKSLSGSEMYPEGEKLHTFSVQITRKIGP